MKTKRLWLLAFAMTASTMIFAQTTFGVKAGVNFFNLNGKDASGDKWDNKLKTGYEVGANVEIPVGVDFYLQPGVSFISKGAKADGADITFSRNYVEVPVNFIYKPALGSGKMLLGFGPYVAYGVGGRTDVAGVETDVDWGNDSPAQVKPFDAGGNLLVGYEFANKLSAQLNASLGMINSYNRPANDTKTTVKNTGFGVSLGYRF